MKIYMVNVEEQAEMECAEPKCNREDLAYTYAFGMRNKDTDWVRMNAAILKRFKVTGLMWIKKRALQLRENGGVK